MDEVRFSAILLGMSALELVLNQYDKGDLTQSEAATALTPMMIADDDTTLSAVGARIELLQELLRVARSRAQAATN